MRPVMGQYYRLVRRLLHSPVRSRICLSRCRDCKILFLTHPRNTGRQDLRCPFGCRQTNRRQSSINRSTQYYRTTEGKLKKQIQNGRRTEKVRSEADAQEAVAEDSLVLDEEGLKYLQTVISIIEQRCVSRQEIELVLRAKMRQHSIGKQAGVAYHYVQTDKKPP